MFGLACGKAADGGIEVWPRGDGKLGEAEDVRLQLDPTQSDPLGRIIARSKATANSVDIAVKTNADFDA